MAFQLFGVALLRMNEPQVLNTLLKSAIEALLQRINPRDSVLAGLVE